MPQSLVQVYVHIVFSTKDRRPFLQDKDEFRRLCQLHGVAIDERYVWDCFSAPRPALCNAFGVKHCVTPSA